MSRLQSEMIFDLIPVFVFIGAIFLTWFLTWLFSSIVNRRQTLRHLDEIARDEIEKLKKEKKEMRQILNSVVAERDELRMQVKIVRQAVNLEV